MPKYNLLTGGITCIGGAIIFFIMGITKPNIKHVDDLYFIKGHFRGYDFFKEGGRYNNTIYTFSLKEFSNSFEIKAIFLSDFEKNKFTNLQYGDDLTISISPDDIINLNTKSNNLFVFSIANNQATFLGTEYTIKTHNSNIIYYYYAATGFLLIGGVLLYQGIQWTLKRRRLRRKKQ